MDIEPRAFNSVEEECRFWKEQTKICRDDWLAIKQEYDEFIELSKQMESEMDVTLKQKQCKIDELNAQVIRLEDTNEVWKQKVASQKVELTNFRLLNELTQKEQETLKNNLRSLEQKNDDLERITRTLRESMNDMSESLDKAYEKNALLENELEEKVVLEERLQRMTGELRDLKLELRNTKLDCKAKEEHVEKGKTTVPCFKRKNQHTSKVNAQKPNRKNAEKPQNANAVISNKSHNNSLSILNKMLIKLNTMQEDLDLEVYRDASSE